MFVGGASWVGRARLKSVQEHDDFRALPHEEVRVSP